MLSVLQRLGLLAGLLIAGHWSAQAQLYLDDGQAPHPLLAGSGRVTLSWNASPDTSVVGYFLCWGWAIEACTNVLSIGNTTNATLGGLEANVTWYFRVLAADAAGEQSAPSNEIACTPPDNAAVVAAPQLDFELLSADRAKVSLRLSFAARAGINYHLEATTDFQLWETLETTNCAADAVLAVEVSDVADYPQRFFRLMRE